MVLYGNGSVKLECKQGQWHKVLWRLNASVVLICIYSFYIIPKVCLQ